ncbi:MAG: hypothetical protein QNJ08_14850 [Crocosphaera sp.]|nr:hypothetical protein [Crocosphaera sp.]
MMTFTQKLFSVAGLSTFMTLLMSAGMVQAVPTCYMVNQAGQTVDLSYMCNQNNPSTQPQASQQAERTFSRRVPVDNPTFQESTLPYTDFYTYDLQQRRNGNDHNIVQEASYYNRLLEFPRSMPRRRVFPRQVPLMSEIDAEILGR